MFTGIVTDLGTIRRSTRQDPARADLRLRYLPDALELEVTDTGAGARASRSTAGSGLGHVGMRERVDLHHGTLAAGPRDGGGFEVHAVIPVAS